jgi:hypothetical protein
MMPVTTAGKGLCRLYVFILKQNQKRQSPITFLEPLIENERVASAIFGIGGRGPPLSFLDSACVLTYIYKISK